jgi:malate dehydrogenase (oxaloacetate-decarboxylating)
MGLFNPLKEHAKYRGKIQVLSKVPIQSLHDFSVWYTPGVALPCLEIFKNAVKAYSYTNKSNSIAIMTNGTRVLGLGNIGPGAGLPVMEGKALIFKILGDVDAFPLCIRAPDAASFVSVARAVEPSFGGINLEDIESPVCFEINDELVNLLDIPVFHDDQHGTSVVVLAALINAMKVVGKKLAEAKVVVLGAGSAGYGVSKLLLRGGVVSKNLVVVDSKGVIYASREDLGKNKWKLELAALSNLGGFRGNFVEALVGADVLIAVSKPGPGTITTEMVKRMASDSIVFACANPNPEIMPDDAKKGGARIVATGLSSYPNQVNNSLVFPAMFRGMLDVWARRINDDMKIAAASEIAKVAESQLSEDYILPTMEDQEVFPREAMAVGKAAQDSDVARLRVDPNEIYEKTKLRLERYRKIIDYMSKEDLFPTIYPNLLNGTTI